MDWGQFDQEVAIRQRYLEVDERTEDAKGHIARGRWSFAEFQEMYDISWIYHENGLEGVVLTYPEIKSAVDNQIISDVSLLPTYRDIKNQKACIDKMRQWARSPKFILKTEHLLEIHGKLVQPTAKQPTPWRRDIPIHRTYFHEIAAPQQIVTSLAETLTYLETGLAQDLHPIELAANVHHRFMRVFPFAHHSGMLGRLLLNFVLARATFLPVIIHASDRQRYYEALRGTERDFRNFVVDAMDNSLENAIRFFTGSEKSVARA